MIPSRVRSASRIVLLAAWRNDLTLFAVGGPSTKLPNDSMITSLALLMEAVSMIRESVIPVSHAAMNGMRVGSIFMLSSVRLADSCERSALAYIQGTGYDLWESTGSPADHSRIVWNSQRVLPAPVGPASRWISRTGNRASIKWSDTHSPAAQIESYMSKWNLSSVVGVVSG